MDALRHGNFRLATLLSVIFLGLAIAGCDGDDDAMEWKLVWEDTFDGDAGTSPDSANWTFDIGTGWDSESSGDGLTYFGSMVVPDPLPTEVPPVPPMSASDRGPCAPTISCNLAAISPIACSQGIFSKESPTRFSGCVSLSAWSWK